MSAKQSYKLSYSYDESKNKLSLKYVKEDNMLVITGGYHGLACLAELFYSHSLLINRKTYAEDEHWRNLLSEELGLTITALKELGAEDE